MGTFCEGNTGAYAALCLSEEFRIQGKEKLLAAARAAKKSSDLACELWYGIAGVMHSLLWVESLYFPGDEEIKNLLKELFDETIKRGKSNETKMSRLGIPLYYEWHGKCYFGLVHGFSGIIGTLLHVYENFFNENEKLERLEDRANLLKLAEYLLTQKLDSGNYRSSLGSNSDSLVQICHGAPGLCLMFIRLFETTKDQTWLGHAIEAGEVIWAKGLLR